MYSLNNLKHHCRTCLIKLEDSNESEDSKRMVSIASVPDVEHLMHLCLVQHYTNFKDANVLEGNMPNLCRLCVEKWQDFSELYLLAIKNNKKLLHILQKELLDQSALSKNEEREESNEIFIDTGGNQGVCEIEKYETVSPFYQDSRSNTPNNDLQQNEKLEKALDDALQYQQDDSGPPTPKSENTSDDDSTEGDEVFETTKPPQSTKTQSKRNIDVHSKKCKSKSKIKHQSPNESDNDNCNNSPAKLVKTVTTKKAHYRCIPCKKYFYEIRKYEAHVKAVHEGAKKPYQCKECDKAYKFHKTLIDHIALNHSDKPLESYKCDICNNMFKTQITLKTHVLNKHPQSDAESRRIICDQCGFLAVNQISLKKHIKNRHTEAEELKCDECPKVFKNQYYLKYHKMNFHNPMNIKPFACTECNMAFTRQSLLNTHKRSHLDIAERIKCDFEGCEVRFLQQAEKRRHMRLVHLKVKQYVCDICGAAFGTKPTLRHHRYIHTNEKPYKCNVCGQGFRQRSAMKTHRKIHVGKEVVGEKKSESSLMGVLPEINASLENILT